MSAAYVATRNFEIGRNLRAIRIIFGLSQLEIAGVVGCLRKRVDRIESGAVAMSVGEMEVLAEYFGIDWARFTQREQVSRQELVA